MESVVADRVTDRKCISERPVAQKSDIARGFGKASPTYERASRLQRFTGDTMLQRLVSQHDPGASLRILDLGCGTGWFARKFQQRYPGSHVTGIDLSPGMIDYAKSLNDSTITWLVADATQLPLPDSEFDLIFSNLMIQWCENPELVLRECRRLLKPQGRLMISTLVDETLWELQQAWAKADPEGNHVNHFEPFASLAALAKAELPRATAETHTIRLPYSSPMELASELKSLGAGYKGSDRRKTVTAPGRFRDMCRYYPRESHGAVIGSYEAAWIYWQKPKQTSIRFTLY
jgi:malonyl-CoA O-methyltransferase